MSFGIVIPLIIAGTAIVALSRKTDVYSSLISGISDGGKVVIGIFPALIALLSAYYMLRASGALDAFTSAMTPVFNFFGIPPEIAGLVLLRPLSGSGALAVGSELINRHGPDSLIGRTAAIMLGSTETTFYAIAVYFGAAKIKRTRYAVPAALTADFICVVTAALTTKLLFF
ncbi:MAG: spore maturation protein [Clostridiales bacterium]|jgi:spore maturation protein B|nr:spore maturation protein [Clostridiales bacterium]